MFDGIGVLSSFSSVETAARTSAQSGLFEEPGVELRRMVGRVSASHARISLYAQKAARIAPTSCWCTRDAARRNSAARHARETRSSSKHAADATAGVPPATHAAVPPAAQRVFESDDALGSVLAFLSAAERFASAERRSASTRS